ncbi:hypothetical protein tb265_31080 [Gemmatimonadetes bacterium T265]|nr:hypothetical protein tb265_31080 [Gemmatimonadetes bacterium T265]
MAPPPRSVWLVTLYYAHGWEHGSHLRTFAIARDWVRRGAAVHFVAVEFDHTDPTLPGPYLERLRAERVITGFDRLRLRHTWFRGKVARAVLHPAARDVALGPERRGMIASLDAVTRTVAPDAFVITDPHLLFAAPHLRRYAPVTIDWKDSHTLQYARAQRGALRRRDWREAASLQFRTWESALYERYYGRRADHNVLVSPVDAAEMARVIGSAATVHTVANGIRARPTPTAVVHEPDRLIFTGTMDFGPNHHSALWFIREVLPRVVARRSGVRFVVAGTNPAPELRALAGPNVEVTGWVDDMRGELARSALYVAPMVEGSGFKNKVVEALAAGVCVVGTSMAFEFLPDRLRTLFSAADDPEGLAAVILDVLDRPSENAATVAEFWRRAGDEYEWGQVAERFAGVVDAPSRRDARAVAPDAAVLQRA